MQADTHTFRVSAGEAFRSQASEGMDLSLLLYTVVLYSGVPGYVYPTYRSFCFVLFLNPAYGGWVIRVQV